MADPPPTTLATLLSNHIILQHLSPYLPLPSLLHLTATSSGLRNILLSSPAPFARLDLRSLTAAQPPKEHPPLDRGGTSFRAERMDEALTEDDFYAGPLRGTFSRLGGEKLSCVGTLVLDGLCVPAELVREIIADERFGALRVLSLRGCEHLNHRVLGQGLRYAVRKGRAEGMPRLRALYVFGTQDGESVGAVEEVGFGVLAEEGAQIGGVWEQEREVVEGADPWYRKAGEVVAIPNGLMQEWSETVEACRNVIAFDAVLCRGPKHDVDKAGMDWLGPSIATVSLGPCASCGSCPEGAVVFGDHDEATLPLLAPPPLHSTTVKAAQRPDGKLEADGTVSYPSLTLRCRECLRQRWCHRCNKWWCEACYQLPSQRSSETGAGNEAAYWGGNKQMGVQRECWDCGLTCAVCTKLRIRTCRICQSEFCLLHTRGRRADECDWCGSSGRRTREMY